MDVGPASAGKGEAQAFVSQTVGGSWVVGRGTISLLGFRLGSASHLGPSHPFPDPDNRPDYAHVTSRSLDRRLQEPIVLSKWRHSTIVLDANDKVGHSEKINLLRTRADSLCFIFSN